MEYAGNVTVKLEKAIFDRPCSVFGSGSGLAGNTAERPGAGGLRELQGLAAWRKAANEVAAAITSADDLFAGIKKPT
ncbi:hypothetical protein [Methylomonas koyamae]|uniref:hypothetical protein n=1 Tax=Methylomonas koyamae TaxID=702114 RepID=UPI000B14E116|nr:hypothetical protein [Methylomonas koyamae]